MNGLLELSSTAVAGLFSAVWQGCVLAAAVALGLRMLPRLSAAARAAIWLFLFVLLAGLQVAPLLARSGSGGAAGHAAVLSLDARWSLAVAAVWLVFSALRAAQLAMSVVRLRRLVAGAVEVEPSAELARMLERRDGSRVRLCLSDAVERPCVLGFFKPRILLPPGLMEALTAEELELVVAHEMEHLRRSDDWSNLGQKLGLVVFPLNPALAWVERRLCAERELACDDQVLKNARGPKAYALCLARLAEFSAVRSGLALALGAWEQRPELVRRIERMIARPARGLEGRRAWAFSCALAGLALLLALGLARTPAVVGFAPQLEPALEARVIPGKNLLAASPLVLPTLPVKEAVAAHKAARPAVAALPVPATPASESEPATLLVLTSMEEIPVSGQVLLTNFDEMENAPQVIFAVERVHRSRYAAVPVLGGWIIVQI